MSSLFDTVSGLPVHPLVVHFAVVLLPLAATAIAISVYIPRFRAKFAFSSVVGTFVGLVAAVVAKLSGEELASRVGLPQSHANYGNQLPIIAGAFFAISVLWYLTIRKNMRAKPTIIGHVAAVLAVAVLGFTFLTGHSGAEAVWKGRFATDSNVSDSNSNAQSPAVKGYSLAEVAKHASGSSCWSVIDGSVYDLTKWINKHPGGAAVIKGICGKDGTNAFNGKHKGQARPTSELANYKIGALK